MAVLQRRARHAALGVVIDDDESEVECLTRTKQWLPGERAAFEAARLN